MNQGVIFAILAAIAFGVWTVFHQQAAEHINYLFGAIVISLTAAVIGVIMLLPKAKSVVLYTSPKGVIFAAVVGIFALLIDIFALKAYGSGLGISVGGPIIIGGSIAIAAFIGLFLGESITMMKVFALLLVIVGSGVLASMS